MRGYGRSDKSLPNVRYGIERHARDVLTVMDAA
jgi:pimeloyl-ACP methyl ester carboxylesterase